MTAAGETAPVWTTKAALDWTQGYLERKGDENPRLSAQWLLCHATGLSRLELYTCFDRLLTPNELSCLREAVKRRGAGEPLQYIRGLAAFRHLELRVSPKVLIPRPETETLVQLVLDWLNQRQRATQQGCDHPCILDIATGSGCIALSLLQEYPDAQVLATDISPEAVLVAEENARLLKLDEAALKVIQDDLAGSLIDDIGMHGGFDVIISNPPYIPTVELERLPREVADFEPVLALDGGADGLEIFRRIIEQAAVLLKPGGLLACELYETSLDEAAACLDQRYNHIAIHNDLVGRPRFITAERAGCDISVAIAGED